MTYAVEPAGEEVVNDGITSLPKCLQGVVPTSRNALGSLAPNVLT